MPECVQNEFPALLTKKSAIDRSVASQLVALVENGVSYSAFAEMLLELHHLRFHRMMVSYLRIVFDSKMEKRNMGVTEPNVVPFDSSFRRADGYNGFTPTAKYLNMCVLRYVQSNADMWNAYTQRLGGTRLSMDHSFKVS